MNPQNSAEEVTRSDNTPSAAPVPMKRFLVALDQSDYANKALEEAIKLAGKSDGVVTGTHAYAAKLHDKRFRQMEGGLPERYRQEEEMEYQREVHDDLITRGLTIISDSYHDSAQVICDKYKMQYERINREGKNYRELLKDANSGNFDVLALGALGLGAVPGSVIGTVCERMVRRSKIDTLIIKKPQLSIGEGLIVVALDGSAQSFGCLMTAFDLARKTDAEIHVVAAYDPYYHYVAFNAIAGVLSDEAGKVFRFKEQEKLHEELIDDGIAKIYESHLGVAKSIAKDEGVKITCELLDGKIYQAISSYIDKHKASLLIMGKVGIHADDDLDIGGNTENLLRLAKCNIWIGQVTHEPDLDVVANETIMWSEEAEQVLGRAPEFAREMARKAIIRRAFEEGHTFITSAMVHKMADEMMPGRDGKKVELKPLSWGDDALALISAMENPAMANNIRLRAEKAARRADESEVLPKHVTMHLEAADVELLEQRVRENPPAEKLPDNLADIEFTWAAAAIARMSRVPETMRDPAKRRVEKVAAEMGVTHIDLDVAEKGLEEAKKAMCKAMKKGGHPTDDKS